MSNPDLVTDQNCEEFITVRGKGWVCELDKIIVGFAIDDLKDNNIWALFLDQKFEKKGIRQLLHKTILDWYIKLTKEKVWLGTAFNTRLEKFYRKTGWKEVGTHGTKEIKFEMPYNDWAKNRTVNIGLSIWRLKCFYEIFVQGSTLEFYYTFVLKVRHIANP